MGAAGELMLQLYYGYTCEGSRHQYRVEAPWTQISQVARQLLDRKFVGKAVLHVADEPR
jgi:hypothetical protein